MLFLYRSHPYPGHFFLKQSRNFFTVHGLPSTAAKPSAYRAPPMQHTENYSCFSLQTAACSVLSWQGHNIYDKCGISADLKKWMIISKGGLCLHGEQDLLHQPPWKNLPKSNLFGSHSNSFCTTFFFVGLKYLLTVLTRCGLSYRDQWYGGNWQPIRKPSLPWSCCLPSGPAAVTFGKVRRQLCRCLFSALPGCFACLALVKSTRAQQLFYTPAQRQSSCWKLRKKKTPTNRSIKKEKKKFPLQKTAGSET